MDLTGPREVRDPAGVVVARVTVEDRRDWLQADVEWLHPDRPRAEVAALLREALPGLRVATLDAGLARALVADGGIVTRAGAQLALDLAAVSESWLDPSWPAGVQLAPYTAEEQVAAARAHAYGPGHPDHQPLRDDPAEAVAELRRLLSGGVTGPVLEAATALLRDGDRVLGGVLVTLMPPNPLWAGPWVTDVFTVPSCRGLGLGSALVRYAAAATARAGHEALALAVSDGNPARQVYERIGFVATHSFTTVALPAP